MPIRPGVPVTRSIPSLCTSKIRSIVLGDSSRTPSTTPPHATADWSRASERALPGTEKALASLWDDLGNTDAGRADAAIWALVAAPQQAPALLKKNVRPTPAPPPGWRDWVKDLGSGQFAVREKASRALEALEERAYPLLKQELTGTTPLEVRRRIKLLLDKLAYPLKSPQTIRELRGVEVLEHIGTEPARQVLQVLARGESGSRLTEEARASLGRLAQRKAP